MRPQKVESFGSCSGPIGVLIGGLVRVPQMLSFAEPILSLICTSQVASFLKQIGAQELPPLVAKVVALQRAKLG